MESMGRLSSKAETPPGREGKRTTPRVRAGRRCRLLSSGLWPSAPASDRICWPFGNLCEELAGCPRRSRARRWATYRRWGIAPRP